jgi:hypothetical protein
MLQKRVKIGIVLAVIVYIGLTAVLATIFFSIASIIVSAMASVALVIVTAALVSATLAYTEAANRQVTALTNPVVFFGEEEFESSTISQLFVQNVGPGIAYDLNFKVIKDFEQAVVEFNQKLSDLAFIKTPMKTLAPGQKVPFAVLSNRKSLLKETLQVEVSYKNKPEAKEPVKQAFSIDFAYQEEMRQVRRSVWEQLQRIADSIDELKKS